MRDEIWAGLKNALERGQPLEQAVQSFINAGYNALEVKEAARNISEGASSIVASQPGEKEAQKTSAQAQQSRPSAASANLQAVTIAQDPKDIAVKDIQTDPKILYVPPQKVYSNPQVQKINKEYIPYDGAKSTRRKRMAILLSFLIFLVLLLILTILYYNDLLDLIKGFYTG